jgi:hypothetical protein
VIVERAFLDLVEKLAADDRLV